MLAKVQSCAVIGLEGALVEVEVDLSNGLAAFNIVGLPDAAINESRERVRSAIKNCGCLFPYKRITANLAPADLRKEGPAYDLPIAIGVLLASGQINPINPLDECLFLGELSLLRARNASTLSSSLPPTLWRHLYSAVYLSIL